MLDGVTLSIGDRILLKDQASAFENGVYVVGASGAPVRAVDFDGWTEIVGSLVGVDGGTVNAGRIYRSTVTAGGTLGTTGITFSHTNPGAVRDPEVTTLAKARNLRVGVDGFSVDLTDGRLALAIVDVPEASGVLPGARFVAVKGEGLGGTLTLPGITASAAGLKLEINLGSDAAGDDVTPLDWTTALDLNKNGVFADNPGDRLFAAVSPTTSVLIDFDATKRRLIDGDLTGL